MPLMKSAVFLLLNIISMLDITYSDPVTCNKTVILEHNKHAVISCDYSENFIAVFWYRNEAENPFLRLEEQRRTSSDGFDITERGDMVIQNVQIKDEGSYRISVLDANGVSNSATLQIKVRVFLHSQPFLQSCSSSELDSCLNLEEEKRGSILICQTTATRPAVQLSWYRLYAGERDRVDELRSNSSVNSSTGLFMSYSMLELDSNSFSMQYFTCKALGLPVIDTKEVSIFVEGAKNVETVSETDRHIYKGSPLNIPCSNEINELSTWKLTYPNNTIRTLKRNYPSEEGGDCQHVANCYVQKDGSLTVEDVTHENEGSYECSYSNGERSGRSITHLYVLFTPNPEKIIIEGCKETKDCTRNVAHTGKLQAIILGVRPVVELTCEVDEASKSGAFLFNHKTEFEENSDRGTFDIIYTAEYEIQPCSNPVHIVCKVPQGFAHDTLPSSDVYLVTASSNCERGGPGLVVFLIILILIILVVSVVVVVYLRRRKGYSSVPQNTPLDGSHKDTNERETKDRKGEENKDRVKGDIEASENDSKVMKDQPGELSAVEEVENSSELDTGFRAFCEDLRETKAVRAKTFEDLMGLFQEHDKRKPAGILLMERMTSSEDYKEEVKILLEYLVALIPNNWVPILDFCKMLEDLTDKNKLPIGELMTCLVQLLNRSQITLTTFVEVMGNFLKVGKTDDITIVSNLKNLLWKEKISKGDFITSILKYLSLYKMKEETILQTIQEIQKTPFEVPYTMFLQEIHKHTKITPDECLSNLFYEIIENVLSRNYRSIISIQDEGEKGLTHVYIQAVMFSVVYHKIDVKSCISTLTSDKNDGQVQLKDIKGACDKCMQNDKVPQDEKNQIFVMFLQILVKMVSDDNVKELILQTLHNGKEDSSFWITWTIKQCKNKSINETFKSRLILTIADTYLLLKDDFKKMIDEQMGKENRKTFLENIQFEDDLIRRKRKSEEKKAL